MRLTVFLAAAASVCLLPACTSRMAYESGQAWQRNQCDKIVDMTERQRCIAQANLSYDKYQRQADEARGAK